MSTSGKNMAEDGGDAEHVSFDLDSPKPKVLVVEDEAELADTYAEWLDSFCDVALAYDGDEALEVIDDDVNIVLLDRQMPSMTGDEVLEEIRDAGYNVRVAMVTAVDPDFDIVDMEFDDYVTKPVSGSDLTETVDSLLLRGAYSEQVRELFSLVSKKIVLRQQKNEATLKASEEFSKLEDRIAVQRAKTNETVEALFDEGKQRKAVQEITTAAD